MNCFAIYFNPIYIYIKKAFELAFENQYIVTITAVFVSGTMEVLLEFFDVNWFGVPNILLLLVLINVFVDAGFGITKSLKQSKEALIESEKHLEGTPKKKMLKKKHQLKKFDVKKLQYTFFKCFTLLGYMYFAKVLVDAAEAENFTTALTLTSEAIIKTPLAIFWYYDFKSIGNNSAYIYGKKAPIFEIIEVIFELKFKQFFKKDKDENSNSSRT
jgi:hypothetical protein